MRAAKILSGFSNKTKAFFCQSFSDSKEAVVHYRWFLAAFVVGGIVINREKYQSERYEQLSNWYAASIEDSSKLRVDSYKLRKEHREVLTEFKSDIEDLRCEQKSTKALFEGKMLKLVQKVEASDPLLSLKKQHEAEVAEFKCVIDSLRLELECEKYGREFAQEFIEEKAAELVEAVNRRAYS